MLSNLEAEENIHNMYYNNVNVKIYQLTIKIRFFKRTIQFSADFDVFELPALLKRETLRFFSAILPVFDLLVIQIIV